MSKTKNRRVIEDEESADEEELAPKTKTSKKSDPREDEECWEEENWNPYSEKTMHMADNKDQEASYTD